jgi:KDO2-lipid IV(A) lauroyltransferase
MEETTPNGAESPEPSYRYRAHPFARAEIFRLGADSLIAGEGAGRRRIPYSDFKAIESFPVRFAGSSAGHLRRIMHLARGNPIMLTASYRDRFRLVDRRAAFQVFIDELQRRIDIANPDREFIHGRLLLNRAGGLGGKLVVAAMRLVGRTGPDRWADAAAWVMRHVGPRLRGHKRALEQLALAFPEKSAAERERIAVGMWDNLARTIFEYTQLDRLWDYDPAHPGDSRIIRDPGSMQVWADIKAANQPTLHFSLHLANWELAATAGKDYVRCLIPYRRLKNEALNDELVRVRRAAGIVPLAAGPFTISEVRQQFGPGTGLGMLIDQRYVHGIDVTFFGRPTTLNPLFARLARVYDCPIYGSRVIRIPGRRFRYEIIGPIEPARDARGRVDVHATMQKFAAIMERWVREYPEQWMWLQRVWR